MKCNKCWRILENDTAFLTSCSHIFCELCAKKQFSMKRECPVCDSLLTSRSSITGLDLVADDSKVIQLCGLSPRQILDISSKAIEFAQFQKSLEMEFLKNEARKRENDSQQREKNLGEKVLEHVNEINQLKHTIGIMNDESKSDKKQIQELKEQVVDYSRQKRKLVDLYESSKSGRTSSNGNSSPGSIHKSSNSSFQPGRIRSPPVPPRKEFPNNNDDIFEFNTDQLAKSQQKSNLSLSNPLFVSSSTPSSSSTQPINSFLHNNNQKSDRFALLRNSANRNSPGGNNNHQNNQNNIQSPSIQSNAKFSFQRPSTPLFAKRNGGLLSSV